MRRAAFALVCAACLTVAAAGCGGDDERGHRHDGSGDHGDDCDGDRDGRDRDHGRRETPKRARPSSPAPAAAGATRSRGGHERHGRPATRRRDRQLRPGRRAGDERRRRDAALRPLADAAADRGRRGLLAGFRVLAAAGAAGPVRQSEGFEAPFEEAEQQSRGDALRAGLRAELGPRAPDVGLDRLDRDPQFRSGVGARQPAREAGELLLAHEARASSHPDSARGRPLPRARRACGQ
jgi:hypothetical protein